MSVPQITLDELLKELNASSAPPKGYETAQQLAARWGVHHHRAMRILQQAQAAGRLDVKRLSVTNIAGMAASKPGYRILPAKGKKK